MTAPHRRLLTLFVLAVALVAISSSSVLIKMCSAPALTIALYRVGIASIFYASMTRLTGSRLRRQYNLSRLKLALLSGLFLAAHFAAWITSLNYTSVASSVVLVVTSPIWVAVGGVVILKEKPSLLLIFGIGITFVGSVIISGADFALDPRSLFGNLLAVAGAVAAAGYWLIGRKLRAEIDTFPYVTVVYASCAAFTVILILLFDVPVWGFSHKTILFLLAIALLPQVIGHTSLNWALKYFSATAVAIITLGEPVGAAILAWIFLGQNISVPQFAGGLVILAGVALSMHAEVLAAQVIKDIA
jgi:drug/metabolite transporter (DMT)-like permease